MANIGNFCLYMIAVASCCLSVINYYKYEALKNSIYLQKDHGDGIVDNAHSRERRGLYLGRSECNCQGPKGERGFGGPPGSTGETGLRGPPGEKGKAGLGLFPPTIRSKVINITTNASQDEVMSCIFFGNPIPNTRWEATASNTEVETKIDHETSEITTSLHIRNITWEDRGNVRCFASSILGSDNESGFLTVHVPPILHLPSGPLIATLGSTFKFPECKVISSPPAEVTWERGYRMFPKMRTENNNGVLRISDIKVQDEGYYECIAKNYLGKTRQFIQLRTRPLEFSMKPPFYVYDSNSSVTLTCAAFGSPGRMSGKWSKFIGEADVFYTTSQNEHEFMISMAVNKSGKYKCSITDNVTKIESYTEVDMFKLNSSIMNSEQTHELGSWLRSSARIGEYKLCWSGSRHGHSVSTFHRLCDGKPNTISIFRNTNGSVFGGFTNIPWRTGVYSRYMNIEYGYSSESFVFTFQNKLSVIPVYNKNKAVCYYRYYGPCFGQQELYLHSSGGVNRIFSSIGRSYQSRLITSLASRGIDDDDSRGYTMLDDIEVFYMV